MASDEWLVARKGGTIERWRRVLNNLDGFRSRSFDCEPMSPALRSGLASLPDARLDGGEEGTRPGDPWGQRESEGERGGERSASSSWEMVALYLPIVNSNLQFIRMARVHADEIWGKWKDAKELGVLEGCGKAVEKGTIATR